MSSDIKCPICDETRATRSHLAYHITGMHPSVPAHEVNRIAAFAAQPVCECGDTIKLMDDADPDSWIHVPGSETSCLTAVPAVEAPVKLVQNYPACECGHRIELRDPYDRSSWIHSPGSTGTPCLQAVPFNPSTVTFQGMAKLRADNAPGGVYFECPDCGTRSMTHSGLASHLSATHSVSLAVADSLAAAARRECGCLGADPRCWCQVTDIDNTPGPAAVDARLEQVGNDIADLKRIMDGLTRAQSPDPVRVRNGVLYEVWNQLMDAGETSAAKLVRGMWGDS